MRRGISRAWGAGNTLPRSSHRVRDEGGKDCVGRTKPTHRPHEHGPQVFRRGRYYAADLRPWKGGRPTLRDPAARGWPREGKKTEFEDVARRWAWKYVDQSLDRDHREQTGRPAKAERFSSAKARYLVHRGRQIEMNTLQADGTALNHLETLVGEARPTDRVGLRELQAWFDARLDEGYKPMTLERYRLSMVAFFAWTGGPNPAEGVQLPEQDGRDARAWNDDEITALRKAADTLSVDHRTYLELGLSTGGRYCELLALQYQDFDPARRTVRFRRQVETEYVTRTKGLKSDKNRTALVLPSWWQFHRTEPGVIVKLKRPLNDILRAAKMKEPQILNHAMRHSYARICLENGVPLEVLKKYLGHASITTTECEYGWMREEVASSIGQRVFYGT